MTVIGVRFKNVGKIYYFDPGELTIPKDTQVIVETVRGVEYGQAVMGNREVESAAVTQPLKKVIRIATAEDTQQEESNRKREQEAFGVCVEKIGAHSLDMHLVDVELTFDMNKIIFYFTADGRVDFRELVKDLAAVFRMRIELRQIGVRDEAKIINGIGICGRTLCCATFLEEFQPVSIKMAKEQGLSLNPSKISGLCGRLMCCLKYEEATYEFLNQGLPGVGDLVRTTDGDGEVISVNVLKQLAKVAVTKKKHDDPSVSVYAVSELTILERRPQPDSPNEYERKNKNRAAEAFGPSAGENGNA
jgi:cell fate regulator YaaT (PSP1 superfamily)